MNTLFIAHLRRSILIRCIFLTAVVVTPTATSKRLTTQTDVTSRPQAATNGLAIKPIFEKRPSTIPTSEASSHSPYARARERHDAISSDNVSDDVITASRFAAPEETTISSSIFHLSMAMTAAPTGEETTSSTEDKTTTSRKEGTTKSTKQGTTTPTQKVTVTFPGAGTLSPTEAGTTSSTEKIPAKMGSTRFIEEGTTTSTEERTTTSKVEETAISTESKNKTEIGQTSSTEEKRTPTPTESTTTSIEHSGSNNQSIIPEGTTSSVEDGTKTSTEEETTSKQSDGVPTTSGSFAFQPGFVSVETVKTAKTVLLVSSIVISFVGILLNVPSLVVFRRMSASISNSYIQILLFLDTVCLVINVPTAIVELLYKDVFYLPLYFAYFKIYCAMLVAIATRIGLIILTALMTLDRTLTVMFPMKKSRCCSCLSYPKTVGGVVMLLVFAVICTDGVFRRRIEEYVDEPSGTVYGVMRPTYLFENHMKQFVEVYLVVIPLFQFWTVAVMIVSNVALFVSLIRHDRFMQRAGVAATSQSVLRRNNTFRSVKVVVFYSFVFTLLTLPGALLHVVYIARPGLKESQDNLHTILKHTLPFLDVISSSADFFVLFAMNSAFRDGFRSFLGRQ